AGTTRAADRGAGRASRPALPPRLGREAPEDLLHRRAARALEQDEVAGAAVGGEPRGQLVVARRDRDALGGEPGRLGAGAHLRGVRPEEEERIEARPRPSARRAGRRPRPPPPRAAAPPRRGRGPAGGAAAAARPGGAAAAPPGAGGGRGRRAAAASAGAPP